MFDFSKYNSYFFTNLKNIFVTREVDVDKDGKMDVEHLEALILEDIQKGIVIEQG